MNGISAVRFGRIRVLEGLTLPGKSNQVLGPDEPQHVRLTLQLTDEDQSLKPSDVKGDRFTLSFKNDAYPVPDRGLKVGSFEGATRDIPLKPEWIQDLLVQLADWQIDNELPGWKQEDLKGAIHTFKTLIS